MAESNDRPNDSVASVREEINKVKSRTIFQPIVVFWVVCIVAITLALATMIIKHGSNIIEDGKREWQARLNLIADSRTKEVSGWVERNFRELDNVASNPSLQLYLSELESYNGDTTKMTEEPAQAVFLRNLLIDTARRNGFEDNGAADSALIQANVEVVGKAGLAVINNEAKPLAATPGMPPLTGKLEERVLAAPKDQQSLLDMERLDDNSVRIGFVLPISGIQGDEGPGEQIGAVVGIKPVDNSLFDLLRHPGTTEKTLEAILVRKEGNNVIYLSPMKDGTKPMALHMTYEPGKLAEAFAIANPGTFNDMSDYSGNEILFTSRTVPGTPWVLIEKIGAKEALADSKSRSRFLVTILMLMLGAILLTFLAIWHYASSKRSLDLSKRMSRLALQTAEQERLLRLVADNQPDPIFIVDDTSRYWFANKKAGEEAGVQTKDLIGKMMSSVLGPGTAQKYIDANKAALESGKSLNRITRHNEGEGERVIRSEHIPLVRIPIETLKDPTPGVLIVDQDITAVVSERERRMRTLRQLIDTLVTLVDQRDPFAAHHSEHVARIARSVAIDMTLEPSIIETTEIAGKLMNIGKIVVSSDLLTKKSKLKDEEVQTIRDSMIHSAELLKHIEFDGPVVETLRQAHENVDGTGPMKLKGESILISARIIAVANAFIGMISPRAHRPGISVDEATKMMLANIDTKYDRKVVVALINYLENHGGRAYLAKVMSAPSAA